VPQPCPIDRAVAGNGGAPGRTGYSIAGQQSASSGRTRSPQLAVWGSGVRVPSAPRAWAPPARGQRSPARPSCWPGGRAPWNPHGAAAGGSHAASSGPPFLIWSSGSGLDHLQVHLGVGARLVHAGLICPGDKLCDGFGGGPVDVGEQGGVDVAGDLDAATRSACSPPRPQPSNRPPTSCAGRAGHADTRPVPAPATTSDKPPHSHDHEVRLEYRVQQQRRSGASRSHAGRRASTPVAPSDTEAAVSCTPARRRSGHQSTKDSSIMLRSTMAEARS
jgi:hypothetical protein